MTTVPEQSALQAEFTKRRDALRLRYMKGDTLEEIAATEAISSERVRQILSDQGRDRGWLKAIRQTRRANTRQRLRDLYVSDRSMTVIALARRFALAENTVRRLLLEADVTLRQVERAGHGTYVSYCKHKCRCSECRAANALRQRLVRAARKERQTLAPADA